MVALWPMPDYVCGHFGTPGHNRATFGALFGPQVQMLDLALLDGGSGLRLGSRDLAVAREVRSMGHASRGPGTHSLEAPPG